MGRFGRRPIPGERAGSGSRKIFKEMRHGRCPERKSFKAARAGLGIQRLNQLEASIQGEHEPHALDLLQKQYAGLAASLRPELFSRSEIQGFVRHSDFGDQDAIQKIIDNNHFGRRPDFLPLHHLVKLLGNGKNNEASEPEFVYLLGSTQNGTIPDSNLRNLRALEYFLLTFGGRVAPGHRLDLKIYGERIQINYPGKIETPYKDEVVVPLRKTLKEHGIEPFPLYCLSQIRSGQHRVGMCLDIVTEERELRPEFGDPKTVLFSYLY
ncbi:hypothetical protein HYU13_00090 [Candidatus Woesearchaeota archaeon]|nr:hypothetical protein [Candidatus Woesearchaeota archaeon]